MKIQFLKFVMFSITLIHCADFILSCNEDSRSMLKETKGRREAEGTERSKRNEEELKPFNRKCGVVYDGGNPVGIIQPFQDNNYRLLPINEQDSLIEESDMQPLNAAVETEPASFHLGNYPSILADFKIDSKMDQSRSKKDVGYSQEDHIRENVAILKSALTNLKGLQDGESLGEELKSVLEDLGLIHEQRSDQLQFEQFNARENHLTDDSESPAKETCGLKGSQEKAKREKEKSAEMESTDYSILDNDADVIPAKKRSDDVDDDSSEYENKITRQIRSRINNLKEEVKREISNLKKDKEEEEDLQREKRNTEINLVDEEKQDLSPVNNVDVSELHPYIRKRRSAIDRKGGLEGGRILEALGFQNRQVFMKPFNMLTNELNDADDIFPGSSPYQTVLVDQNRAFRRRRDVGVGTQTRRSTKNDWKNFWDKLKHKSYVEVDMDPPMFELFRKKKRVFERFRRSEDEEDGELEGVHGAGALTSRRLRLQKFNQRRRRKDQDVQKLQLKDMSTEDLFGGLVQSFEGDLGRYKRIKRIDNG